MIFCVRVMLRDAVDERLAMLEEGTFRATLDVTVVALSVAPLASLRRRASEKRRLEKTSARPLTRRLVEGRTSPARGRRR